ncbi:riboflavin synthase [bacterium]|nr:riboflavin synthase [bacterium]
MFTGIICEIGTIKEKDSASLRVEAREVILGAKVGDSIAVNGVCLTVANLNESSFKAEVMPETLRLTNLGGLKIGDKTNLETALSFSDRLSGHLVAGHIDGKGRIIKKRREGNAVLFSFSLPEELTKYIIKKGSVAVDGISLTVTDVQKDSFSVSIIPHTLSQTILEEKSVGYEANIEVDLIGKYVEKLMAPKEKRLSSDFLLEQGFL